MKYKIAIGDGTSQVVKITSAYFKAWHVWNVEFDNGKRCMLFKIGSEWMQRTEDFLEVKVVEAIGNYIDKIILRRNNLAF
jgi:hypothetical protein